MPENYGVILGQRPEDYMVGASPIPFEERTDGDWTQYLPDGERQKSRYADSMACVSFSANNCVEAQMAFYGIKENLSDRWLAKMSNTQQNGNYLWRVADTIRKQGAVLEDFWPAPKDFTWDSYYSDIPVNVQSEGLKFLEQWDVVYEWVSDLSWESLAKELKHAPIQVVIPGHAVMLVLSTEQLRRYFDSYPPYLKDYTSPFQAAMKIVVTPKTKRMQKEEVRALQVLEGYNDPGGVDHWAGKPLSEYLRVRLEDKLKQEKEALDNLK